MKNENSVDRKTNLQQYLKGAIEDTMAWGEAGIQDCYPTTNKHYARRLYHDDIQNWRDNKSKTPVEAIKDILKNHIFI